MSGAPWRLDSTAAADALRILSGASVVLMPTHQNVDADGLSSPLAVMHALRQRGVRAIPLVTDGVVPANLDFLPGIEEVIAYGHDPLPDYDVLCLIDCADRKRLGGFYNDDPARVNDAPVPVVNIDHHVTNDRFGTVNIVEPGAAAASEIVTDLLASWGTELTRDIAQCLLSGIYGDTLGLRTESTTSRTMRTVADLVDAGANPGPVVDALFRLKPRSSVCLWEEALRRVRWVDTLIFTELTPEVFETCGANPIDAEGLVNFFVGIEGSRVAAILHANDTGWRVSMRSMLPEVDVAAIAAEFGGGGHPRAAGCTVVGGEAEREHFVQRVAELAAASGIGGDAALLMRKGRRQAVRHGYVILDKPFGWTSHDVVAKVRRIVNERRVGHAGTLDPAATGVLPVAVGLATRTVEYLASASKAYRAWITFGVTTDSADGEGQVTSTTDPAGLTLASIQAALPAFTGEIWQRPPMHSAIKIDGKRLYELARRDIEIEVPPRQVTIFRLDVVAWDSPVLCLDVECSKGTYIRSLARDLGERMGTGAHLSRLVRTRTGPFDLDSALTLDQLAEAVEGGEWERIALPPDAVLDNLPRIELAPDQVIDWGHGKVLPASLVCDDPEGNTIRAYDRDGHWLGIGSVDREIGVIRPAKVVALE